MNLSKKIAGQINKKNSCVCVGLDSDYQKIPKILKKNYSKEEAIFQFNKAIIQQTHSLVAAYKINTAFYEAEGVQGTRALKKTTNYLQTKQREILLIADAKRGDIGNTNSAYARAIFDLFKFDALTLHPYLGKQALEPFLKRKDKGFFILCRTSNPGAGEFQDLQVGEQSLPLYQYLAKRVVQKWNRNNNCGLVVGATYPQELAEVRSLAPQLPLLIPGIGSQGGEVKKTINAAIDEKKQGFLVNSSRSIIFASQDKQFAQAAKKQTRKLKQTINQFRKGK